MLPVLPVIIPLFIAALLAALTKAIPPRISCWIALAATAATLTANVALIHASAAQPIVYWFGGWRPRHGLALGISFVIDPLGAGLASLACFLALAALVFSSDYFDMVGNHFHSLMLCFLGAMCGFCLTGDVFNLFVFFELMSAAAFALCAYKTDDAGSLQGALNFAVTNTIAAYFILSGLGLLYSRTGALNMAQMGRSLAAGPVDSLVLIAFVFLVCGYLVKAAVVPFHFWLADAHAVAPTPVCILFSGVMVEMGLFALARLYWTVFSQALHPHLSGVSNLFITLGVITAATGAFMCYIQRNVKRLLAFSTIGHVGLMTIGIGLFTPRSLAGVAVYVLGHGLVKAALFLIAGILLHRFGTVDEFDLRGKGRRERWPAIIFFAAAIGLAAVPPSGLAAGDDLIHASLAAQGLHWASWLSIAVSAITSAAALRVGGRVFLGLGAADDQQSAPKHDEKPETQSGHNRTPLTMVLPAALLALTGLLLGLVPNLQSVAAQASEIFENAPAYAAHVLEGQPVPPAHLVTSVTPHLWSGLLAALLALSIATAHLLSPQARHLSAAAAKPLRFLHRLHSGHVADYVAFLTLGMATLGLVCAYFFHAH